MHGRTNYLSYYLRHCVLRKSKDLGSIGLKGFIYFKAVSTAALAVGIFGSLLFAPGVGMRLDAGFFDASSAERFLANSKDVGLV